MRQDYFTRFAQQLLAMHSQDTYSIEWSDVDNWLADAPENAPKDAAVVWTELLCLAIARGTRESMDHAQLIDSLGGYLDRLLVFSGSDLADITTLSTFASLMRLITLPCYGADVPMNGLVASGWSPTPLMTHIENNCDAILTANKKKYGFFLPMCDTGAGKFYPLVQQMIMCDTWVPPSNPIYGVLFEHYSISDISDTKKDTRFIRTVLQAAPSAFDKGLCFARRQAFLREAHLNIFFPMILETVNPESLLDSLIALVVDEPDDVKGKTMPLLEKYHPELAQLVSMHLSIFPDAEPGATYAALLVEPYLRIAGMQRNTVHDAVDPSVFDGTDCKV